MKVFPAFFLLVVVGFPVVASPWQPFTTLAASADGRYLATGGSGGEVLWWELSTGEVLRKWQLPQLPLAGLGFDPTGHFLAAVLTNERAYLLGGPGEDPKDLVLEGSPWASLVLSARHWKQVGSPMSGTEAARAGAVARGRPDGTISVSGISSIEVSWQAHGSAVTGLAWSPDGQVLTSCSYDGSLARWDPLTGKLLARL